jgi:hypothetical protein
MHRERRTQPSLADNRFWNQLFRFISSDWAKLVLEAWQLVRAISAERAVGLYEVLDFEHALELCDPHGKKAIYHKRETVRFLQDFVSAYLDQAWGPGKIFADYKCSPGVPVDRFRDGRKHKVLISLRETKRRGENMHIRIDRTVRNGFCKKECWSDTDISHRTKRMRLSVTFPKERPCKRMVLVEENAGRTTPLDLSKSEMLLDGRQRVSWKTDRPVLFETYNLKWVW